MLYNLQEEEGSLSGEAVEREGVVGEGGGTCLRFLA